MARILVIDDDPDLREMLRFLLTQANYDVVQAADGLEGLRLAWEDQPDLILLDVMLPTVDGHQVLQRLREVPETDGIPIIMLTAISTAKRVQSLIDQGATDYVVKPFEPYALLDRVKRAVAGASPRPPGKRPFPAAPLPQLAVVAAPDDWRVSLLTRALAARGRVETTESLLEAQSLAAEGDAVVIFLQPELDESGGPVLVRRLRENPATSSVYLVALVAQTELDNRRLNLLGSGFDAVMGLPPSHQALDETLERARQPRASFAEVRDGVVVLAVVSLSSAAAVARLRDAMLDFRQASLNRAIVDLRYATGASSALPSLGPFFRYLVSQGIQVRLVTDGSAPGEAAIGEGSFPQAFPSVERALEGWR